MNNEELKIGLGVSEWLELIKEDKNLNGAYISICQYIHLTERENQELKKQLESCEKLKNSLLVHNAELMYEQEKFINCLKELEKVNENEKNKG